MPQIPKAFLDSPLASQILILVTNGFVSDQKGIIYLYCFVNLPISEIESLTGLSNLYIVSTLASYSRVLTLMLDAFKRVIPYDATNLVPVAELFEHEIEKGVV